MKAKELLKAMLDWADAPVEDTVDCFKIGDPEKEIKTIEYRPIENDYCGLILAGIRGLNKKI